MSTPRPPVRKRWLFNAGLVLLSIVVVLAAIEVILRFSVQYMPLNFQKYLPTDVKIIAQTTKNELVPQSYIALLGDSYAAGWGDWYHKSLDAELLGNPPFHSADVIHDVSGLNVLTFARPGQGSFDGIAYFPIRYHKQLQSRGFPLPDPSAIVMYFYEGNDLNNNIRFLKQYGKEHGSLTLEDINTLVKSIPSGELRHDSAIAGYLRRLQFIQRLYVAKFLYVLGKDVMTLLSGADPGPASVRGHVRPMEAWVGGEETEIFGPESPPVYLSEADIDRAISVFESSLRYLMKHYSDSKLYIVYLPSPTMSYQLMSTTIPVENLDGAIHDYPIGQVEQASDLVCRKIADVAARLNGGFLDTRPAIRAAGRVQLIHGPLDWFHFNETGYRVLGSTVAHGLMDWLNDKPQDGSTTGEATSVLAEPHCAEIAKHNGEESAGMLAPQADHMNWD